VGRGKKPAPAKAAASSRRGAATTKRTPPKKSATSSSADETPVVKTGSADKHLADDEPVEPVSSPRRPTRRQDLDEIPDDYD
jgi:hypothetical protein